MITEKDAPVKLEGKICTIFDYLHCNRTWFGKMHRKYCVILPYFDGKTFTIAGHAI